MSGRKMSRCLQRGPQSIDRYSVLFFHNFMTRTKASIVVLRCLLLSMMLTPAAMYGQTDSATVLGTVSDAAGSVVAGAEVSVINTGTNIKTVVKTGAQGTYIVTPLRIGNYSIMVEGTGFKTETRTGIVLQVQDRLKIDFALQVGSVHEDVVVQGAGPMLETESSTLGQVVAAKQITDLPLNGRDYTQLASMTTGVIKIKEGNSLTGTTTASNGNAGGSFAVNGTRGTLNNFMLDGVDNNSNDNGGNVLKTNVDALAEFKVQTSNYSAEFGRSVAQSSMPPSNRAPTLFAARHLSSSETTRWMRAHTSSSLARKRLRTARTNSAPRSVVLSGATRPSSFSTIRARGLEHPRLTSPPSRRWRIAMVTSATSTTAQSAPRFLIRPRRR